MRIAYDPAKNARNVAQRGLSFDEVASLDWPNAFIARDERHDYGGEIRMQAILRGTDGKPYVVIFAVRGDVVWIISFRRAHEKEWRRHARKKA